MTPELKQKWLDALRSGNYVQGEGTLNKGGKMCCLGVLCDVAGYEWESFSEESNHLRCAAGEDYFERDEEREKLGLNEETHRLCYCMNDGTFGSNTEKTAKAAGVELRRHSFAEIADFLEKNL
jgi:hypothetical protein